MNSTDRYRILAVDDSADNCDIILKCFSEEYTVHIARSGENALTLLDRITPDIILLDIIMPGMDGFELCARIKSNETLKDIPVLFLTVKTDSDEVVAGFKAGAADYITKPFNLDELSARVKLHLDLKKNRDLLIQKNNEQSELLHILHHDLSNTFMSLSALTCFLENEMDIELPHFPQIKSAVKNGCDIINMVRTLGESNPDSLKMGAVDLKDSLDKSYSILEHMFREKNITLKIDAEPDCLVYAEKSSLVNSVINNLLTNAVKFSYPDSIINIKVIEKSSEVLLSVEDRGIGIPDAMLNGIFEPGKSVSREGTKRERGTGFGMPLIKKFLNHYDASISIRSNDIESSPESHGTILDILFHKGDYALS